MLILLLFLAGCRFISLSHEAEFHRGYNQGWNEGYKEGSELK